jgi:hypothetical protein
VNDRPVFVSPRYFQLLAIACQVSNVEMCGFHDFAEFLRQLKDTLKAHGRQKLFDDIIKEEVRLVSWGANNGM